MFSVQKMRNEVCTIHYFWGSCFIGEKLTSIWDIFLIIFFILFCFFCRKTSRQESFTLIFISVMLFGDNSYKLRIVYLLWPPNVCLYEKRTKKMVKLTILIYNKVEIKFSQDLYRFFSYYWMDSFMMSKAKPIFVYMVWRTSLMCCVRYEK